MESAAECPRRGDINTAYDACTAQRLEQALAADDPDWMILGQMRKDRLNQFAARSTATEYARQFLRSLRLVAKQSASTSDRICDSGETLRSPHDCQADTQINIECSPSISMEHKNFNTCLEDLSPTQIVTNCLLRRVEFDTEIARSEAQEGVHSKHELKPYMAVYAPTGDVDEPPDQSIFCMRTYPPPEIAPTKLHMDPAVVEGSVEGLASPLIYPSWDDASSCSCHFAIDSWKPLAMCASSIVRNSAIPRTSGAISTEQSLPKYKKQRFTTLQCLWNVLWVS